MKKRKRKRRYRQCFLCTGTQWYTRKRDFTWKGEWYTEYMCTVCYKLMMPGHIGRRNIVEAYITNPEGKPKGPGVWVRGPLNTWRRIDD